MGGHEYVPSIRAKLMPEKSRRFFKALAETAAKHCPDPLHDPLFMSAMSDNIDTTRILLQRDNTFVSSRHVLACAMNHRNLEMLKILLEHGVSINLSELKKFWMKYHLETFYEFKELWPELLERLFKKR